MVTQGSNSPIAVIAVTIGAFAVIVVAMIVIACQVRKNAARASASNSLKEKTKHQSDTEMLQKLESLCPTKSYDEWIERSQVEQDLSDRASTRFTW
ncbi:hypothetical protein Asppvi_005299 [Aspergillus pseudoviridinutans]|uniref:Uncharacterized protein n=1 Tax=Aspergillus pseudoviridinutans TaxID=1517512 RepID=A0A9P3ESG9_9EURO|nr:uncharacterized protein Asppvi_005299 [Aspergillus pseudoviridinutans]GIJ86411.1 hypothetical protein Asppvi_005299 [Aspergillus pseudoviridinutans]